MFVADVMNNSILQQALTNRGRQATPVDGAAFEKSGGGKSSALARSCVASAVWNRDQDMPMLKTVDADINYMTAGEQGEWLVLVGGLVSAFWQNWQKYFPAMTQRYRVLAIDNRGCGQSSSPDLPYTTAMMAGDVLAVMNHLGIARARFIGRSNGGAICQQLVLSHPERVQAMALTSTYSRLGARSHAIVAQWRDTAQLLGFDRFFPFLMTYFYTEEFYTGHEKEVRKQIDALLSVPRTLHGFVNTTHAVASHDTWERLGEIRCPVLLVCGDEDVITPPRHTEAMASRIPGAEHRILTRCAHGVWSERPEVFEQVMEWIAAH